MCVYLWTCRGQKKDSKSVGARVDGYDAPELGAGNQRPL